MTLFNGCLFILFLWMNCARGISENGTCPKDSTFCHDGSACIKKTQLCNSVSDCVDASDEVFCGKTNCSSDRYFPCQNGHQCVLRSLVCDHAHDCYDGSDETICEPSEHCQQKDGRFLCHDNRQCINMTLICDEVSHCRDGSDEGKLCAKAKTECDNKNCDICRVLPDGAVCSCLPGYNLQVNNTCTDIDECTGEDRICSHMCINTLGSYRCDCHHGYQLVNGSKCVANGPDPVLYISMTSGLIGLHLRSNRTVSYLLHLLHDVKSLSVGPNMTLFLSDVKKKRIFSTDLQGDWQYRINTAINVGLKYPESIAVDWLTGHLYIADSEARQILVCLPHGEACTVIFSGLDKPVALEIDHRSRQLYWSESGLTASIKRSWLDGSSPEKFVPDIGEAEGMVVDNTVDLFFWVDFKYKHIESIHLDGSNRKILIAGDMVYPFSIAVFEDRVYWCDLQRGIVTSANKFNGHDRKVILKNEVDRPTAITVQHPVSNDNMNQNNPCLNVDCTSMCLPSNNKHGYRCACPQDKVLGHDNRTCYRDPNVPRIFLGAKKNILDYPLSSTGYQDDLVAYILSETVQNPFAIDVSHGENYVIYSDVDRDVIARVNFSASSIQQEEEILYSKDLHTVEDLCVDYVTGNIYWVETGKGTIEVGHVGGHYHTTLIQKHHSIEHPNSIALDSRNSVFYFSDVGRIPYIGKCNMDGTACVTVVQEVDYHPNDITVDNDRLYFTERHSKKIISVSIPSGTDRLTHWLHHERVPFSIAVHENLIYWTELDHTDLYSVDKRNVDSERTVLHNVVQLRSVAVYDISRMFVKNACSINNGNCSHLCLANPTGRICACSDGFELEPDGFSCRGAQVESKICNGFTCRDGLCIEEQYKCDKNPDCLDKSDEDEAICGTSTDMQPLSQESIASACDSSGCQHSCQPTPSGPKCQCRQGYQLKSDGKTCEDVIGCQVMNGGCSQRCMNTKDGHICQCVTGYEPVSNGSKCIPQDPEPYFVMLTKSRITVIMDQGQKSDLHLVNMSVLAFDVVMETGDIIFSSLTSKSSVYQYKSSTKTVFKLYDGAGSISDIAYDWLGQNLYIADETSKVLQACSFYHFPLVCKSVFHEKIRSLALYPQKGRLFWVNPVYKTIETSWMTGERRKVVVTSPHYAPNSLTIDIPAERLYWIDTNDRRVESCRIDGFDKYTFLEEESLQYFTSVSVFGSYVYVTDLQEKSFLRYSKFGHERQTVARNLETPNRVKVVHPLGQVKVGSTCGSQHCSHLCLLTPEQSVCTCPDGWIPKTEKLQTQCKDPLEGTTVSKIFYSSVTSPAAKNFNLLEESTRKQSIRNTSSTFSHACKMLCLNGGSCVYSKMYNKAYCICPAGYTGSICHHIAVVAKQKSKVPIIAIGVVAGLVAIFAILFVGFWCYKRKRFGEGAGHLVYFRPLMKRSNDDSVGLVNKMASGQNQSLQLHVYEEIDQLDMEANVVPFSVSSTSVDSAFVSHHGDCINLGDSLELIPDSR